MEGNAALTAADAKSLGSTSAHVPLDFDELEDGLASCLGLLGAMLGTQHPLVASFRRGLDTHRSVRLPLRRSITLRLGTRLGAATVMCHFHTETRHWLKEQRQP